MIATDLPLEEEYLAEIREQVCRHCVERPPEGPPCTPLGKVCGIELYLPLLIDAVHQVDSPWVEDYLKQSRHAVCEQCPFHHTGVCPCPMDELVYLVVRAIETVDERHGGRVPPAEPNVVTAEMAPGIAELTRIYEETSGRWTGCDWPTTFGPQRLDLNGIRSTDARALAAVADSDTWREAAGWLARVERNAEKAELAAAAAVAAAQAGDWAEASRQARHAWVLEFVTGRPLHRSDVPTWHALAQAARTARAIEAANGSAGD